MSGSRALEDKNPRIIHYGMVDLRESLILKFSLTEEKTATQGRNLPKVELYLYPRYSG